MTEILALFKAGWTPGGVGIWVLVAVVVGGWWKGLPAVLLAFEKKQSGIETRMEELLEAQAERFNKQLAAADRRHDDCMDGQRRIEQNMLERIGKLEAENEKLRGLINAMRQGEQSMQEVVVRAIKDAAA